MLRARRKPGARLLEATRPLRHLSPSTPAPLALPAGVSRSQIAPFSSQPTRVPRLGIPRPRVEGLVPASASRDPAPRTGVNGAGGGGEFQGWGKPGCLGFTSLPPRAAKASGPLRLWRRPRGARAQAAPQGLQKSHCPGVGARESRCHSLGLQALQPWLKPTAENTERAAKS